MRPKTEGTVIISAKIRCRISCKQPIPLRNTLVNVPVPCEHLYTKVSGSIITISISSLSDWLSWNSSAHYCNVYVTVTYRGSSSHPFSSEWKDPMESSADGRRESSWDIDDLSVSAAAWDMSSDGSRVCGALPPTTAELRREPEITNTHAMWRRTAEMPTYCRRCIEKKNWFNNDHARLAQALSDSINFLQVKINEQCEANETKWLYNEVIIFIWRTRAMKSAAACGHIEISENSDLKPMINIVHQVQSVVFTCLDIWLSFWWPTELGR